jgi:hypothetical protein
VYPVAVSHAADRAPAGALVRMVQGLLLINSLGSAISPLMISPLMERDGDAGLFLAFSLLNGCLVLLFCWRRKVRPAPQPVAPFEPATPASMVGAQMRVTEDLMQGALEHERMEDLSDVVPGVEVAEPTHDALSSVQERQAPGLQA